MKKKSVKVKPGTVAIHMGVDAMAVQAAGKLVLDIIKHPGDPSVLIKALEVVRSTVGVNSPSITNCNFQMGG